jgi:ubiquinone/menaquinone biosynthesis C-methylase UbiE
VGIIKQTAKIILNEHKFCPISGHALLCGRQTVHFNEEEARRILEDEGVPSRNVKCTVDLRTKKSENGKYEYINDDSFFSLFCEAKVSAIDISDYEGADYIWNMCEPIPEELENRFSFIYNGSCLDNVFDPVTFLKNTSRLLEVGGRIVHIEHASLWTGAYLMYSPEWFYDYYSINSFRDCKVYIGAFEHFPDCEVIEKSMDLFSWKPDFVRDPLYSHLKAASDTEKFSLFVFVIAEKDDNSTWDKIPVQAHYRSSDMYSHYSEANKKFSQSLRPILKTEVFKAGVRNPLNQDHYIYCGSDF